MSKKGKVRVSKQAFVNSLARAWPKFTTFEESITIICPDCGRNLRDGVGIGHNCKRCGIT